MMQALHKWEILTQLKAVVFTFFKNGMYHVKTSIVIYFFTWAPCYGNRGSKMGGHFWREIFPHICANGSSFLN